MGLEEVKAKVHEQIEARRRMREEKAHREAQNTKYERHAEFQREREEQRRMSDPAKREAHEKAQAEKERRHAEFEKDRAEQRAEQAASEKRRAEAERRSRESAAEVERIKRRRQAEEDRKSAQEWKARTKENEKKPQVQPMLPFGQAVKRAVKTRAQEGYTNFKAELSRPVRSVEQGRQSRREKMGKIETREMLPDPFFQQHSRKQRTYTGSGFLFSEGFFNPRTSKKGSRRKRRGGGVPARSSGNLSDYLL